MKLKSSCRLPVFTCLRNDQPADGSNINRLLEHEANIHDFRGLKSLAREARYLAANGTYFVGRAHSNEYQSARQWRKDNRPKIKQCYLNSQLFCAECEDGRYFEGFACDPWPLFKHAWAVMPDGKVVDFTFEARDRVLQREDKNYKPAPVEYVGIHVPVEYFRRQFECGYVTPVLEDYLSATGRLKGNNAQNPTGSIMVGFRNPAVNEPR
jgi:hypothetical protein